MKIKLNKKERKVLNAMLDHSGVIYCNLSMSMDEIVAEDLGMETSKVSEICWGIWNKLEKDE